LHNASEEKCTWKKIAADQFASHYLSDALRSCVSSLSIGAKEAERSLTAEVVFRLRQSLRAADEAAA